MFSTGGVEAPNSDPSRFVKWSHGRSRMVKPPSGTKSSAPERGVNVFLGLLRLMKSSNILLTFRLVMFLSVLLRSLFSLQSCKLAVPAGLHSCPLTFFGSHSAAYGPCREVRLVHFAYQGSPLSSLHTRRRHCAQCQSSCSVRSIM